MPIIITILGKVCSFSWAGVLREVKDVKKMCHRFFFFQKRRQYIIASNDKKTLNFSTLRIESDRKVKAIIEKAFKKVKSVKQKR